MVGCTSDAVVEELVSGRQDIEEQVASANDGASVADERINKPMKHR